METDNLKPCSRSPLGTLNSTVNTKRKAIVVLTLLHFASLSKMERLWVILLCDLTFLPTVRPGKTAHHAKKRFSFDLSAYSNMSYF